MNKFLILSAVVILSSCTQHIEKDESSPFYSIQKGSSLILNQSLIIPPNRTTVILQNGQVVTGAALDIYYPNCVFEVKTLREIPETINPDTFFIYKVVDEMQSVSLEKKMVARLGMFNDGGSSDFNYTTIMYLRSGSQPDVLRLSCRHWESAEDNNYLTIKEMRQAMGDIFTLKLVD